MRRLHKWGLVLYAIQIGQTSINISFFVLYGDDGKWTKDWWNELTLFAIILII